MFMTRVARFSKFRNILTSFIQRTLTTEINPLSHGQHRSSEAESSNSTSDAQPLVTAEKLKLNSTSTLKHTPLSAKLPPLRNQQSESQHVTTPNNEYNNLVAIHNSRTDIEARNEFRRLFSTKNKRTQKEISTLTSLRKATYVATIREFIAHPDNGLAKQSLQEFRDITRFQLNLLEFKGKDKEYLAGAEDSTYTYIYDSLNNKGKQLLELPGRREDFILAIAQLMRMDKAWGLVSYIGKVVETMADIGLQDNFLNPASKAHGSTFSETNPALEKTEQQILLVNANTKEVEELQINDSPLTLSTVLTKSCINGLSLTTLVRRMAFKDEINSESQESDIDESTDEGLQQEMRQVAALSY